MDSVSNIVTLSNTGYKLHFYMATFICSLECFLTILFFKPQDNSSELYELGALARGFPEGDSAIHSEATR
jgi:hypothetical protein